eukprot:gnl/Carplike_NY0171/2272_a3066_525.p1 GENE.gnl/Carplike_NY0171/2272_a3066_525~~gnl/Carplike_NY0171/2272_a3066_525.p1  ORF type:complete len:776 (+),score=184.92 gnl/Carplike_NY0171/2272_a3066_525:99-2330(+)
MSMDNDPLAFDSTGIGDPSPIMPFLEPPKETLEYGSHSQRAISAPPRIDDTAPYELAFTAGAADIRSQPDYDIFYDSLPAEVRENAPPPLETLVFDRAIRDSLGPPHKAPSVPTIPPEHYGTAFDFPRPPLFHMDFRDPPQSFQHPSKTIQHVPSQPFYPSEGSQYRQHPMPIPHGSIPPPRHPAYAHPRDPRDQTMLPPAQYDPIYFPGYSRPPPTYMPGPSYGMPPMMGQHPQIQHPYDHMGSVMDSRVPGPSMMHQPSGIPQMSSNTYFHQPPSGQPRLPARPAISLGGEQTGLSEAPQLPPIDSTVKPKRLEIRRPGQKSPASTSPSAPIAPIHPQMHTAGMVPQPFGLGASALAAALQMTQLQAQVPKLPDPSAPKFIPPSATIHKPHPEIHFHPHAPGHRHDLPTVGDNLTELKGYLTDLACTKVGCCDLQKILKKEDEQSDELIGMILAESLDSMSIIMCNPFGNYFFQCLVKIASEEKRTELVKAVAPHLAKLSLNQHGTRSVQALLDAADTDKERQFIRSGLKDHVVPLIRDISGNHVISRCISCFSPDQAEFIHKAVCDNIEAVAKHQHGCCVLQKCISKGNELQQKRFLQSVCAHSYDLVNDQFANYVFQFCLETAHSKPTVFNVDRLIEGLEGKECELCVQKFSSNVIESCIKFASKSMKERVMLNILEHQDAINVMTNRFGNYVIKRIIKESHSERVKEVLKRVIRGNEMELKSSPYGRYVLSSFKARIG